MSIEVVNKLKLKCTPDSEAYRVSWLQNGKRVTMREKFLITFNIGSYSDSILFDVLPMDACHILLGRPWQYDRRVMHDGWRNTYQFEKDGKKFSLHPFNKEVEK